MNFPVLAPRPRHGGMNSRHRSLSLAALRSKVRTAAGLEKEKWAGEGLMKSKRGGKEDLEGHPSDWVCGGRGDEKATEDTAASTVLSLPFALRSPPLSHARRQCAGLKRIAWMGWKEGRG